MAFKPNQQIQEYLEQISEVGVYLWQKGWAERNGGNISMNLTEVQEVSEELIADCPYRQAVCPQGSAGMVLFVTGTGERLRDLSHKIEQVAAIIRIDKTEEGYHILWGGQKEHFRPTSEFISHLTLHLTNSRQNSGRKCIVHAHPTELLAASYHPQFKGDEKRFNTVLWSMLPEVRLFVPNGISVQPYAMPGSEKLAELTEKGLRDHDVVLWRKHGALAAGTDAIDSFDLLDVANKGAAVFLQCLGAGFVPDGLDERELKELEDNYLK